MKKFAIAWFIILGIVTGFASCTDDNEIKTTQFNACTEQSQDKTVVGPDQYLYWISGDEVEIFGDRGHATYLAAPRADDGTWAVLTNANAAIGGGPYTAYYPASIARTETTVELPATQVSPDGSLAEFPMTAVSPYTTLQFKNLCGVLRIKLHKAGTNISRIVVTMDSPINGLFSCSYGEVPEIAYLSDGSCTTTLLCSTPQSIDAERYFYLYVPAGTYSTMQLKIYNDNGEMCVKNGRNIIVERSMYTNLNIAQLPFITEGSVPSLFSVGAGRQVRFSQGNLQYQASNDTWRFALHQYDYVGNSASGNVYNGGAKSSNTNIGPSYSGWIDLFGWGTSGANTGANAFDPYATSTNSADYYPGGSASNDLSGSHANADWGVYNAISNGGNQAGLWRTLTGGENGEWEYLLNRRVASTIGGTANARYAEVRVCGVCGLIIFPDQFTWPASVTVMPTTINGPATGWNDIDYALTEWQQLEVAGCVFLPAGGNRYDAGYCSAGHIGYYWSTIHCDQYGAYCMGFSTSQVYPTYFYNREYGQSVRLVYDINE